MSVKVSTRKSTNFRQVEKKILDRILSPNIYDSQIRPLGTTLNDSNADGSTKVLVNLFVRSFEKIDDVKMEFSIQITFRQQWNDNRLAFHDMGGKIKYLTMTERSKVWMPDTFFRNEKDAKFHEIIQPNLYVRVFPNGDVLYSIRVRNGFIKVGILVEFSAKGVSTPLTPLRIMMNLLLKFVKIKCITLRLSVGCETTLI